MTVLLKAAVVALELRGYGFSSKPPDGENRSGHSKRAMAMDQAEELPEQTLSVILEFIVALFEGGRRSRGVNFGSCTPA